MISSDKRTDFYGRYDATSEKMRYDEIEQRFRDKFTRGQLPQTPVQSDRVVIETIAGRRPLAESTVDAMRRHVELFAKAGTPMLGFIAIQENNATPIIEASARGLFSDPSYARNGGWAVIHPTLPMTPAGAGGWQQDYGEFSRMYVNTSGDIVFQKAIDEVLCWTQNEKDFAQQPRLYPNALIEYCLSFAYALADVAALINPAGSLVALVLNVDPGKGARLPLGEGGSVWFNSPVKKPNELHQHKVGIPIPLTAGAPIHPRALAFAIAAQIYAMFGYTEADVPFSHAGLVTFGAGEGKSGVSAIRSFLRSTFGFHVAVSALDFGRDVYWFRVFDDGTNFKIVGFTEEFVDDFASDENVLFAQLSGIDIAGLLADSAPNRRLVITTSGPKYVDAS